MISCVKPSCIVYPLSVVARPEPRNLCLFLALDLQTSYMSSRTRSSTRIRGLQPMDESQGNRESEADSDEEPFDQEEREQEIWDEVREEHYDGKPPHTLLLLVFNSP